MVNRSEALKWNSDSSFLINNYEFELSDVTNENKLVMLKVKGLVEVYSDKLALMHPDKIIEVGIARGGSAAFINELIAPSKLLCVDIADTTNNGFSDYLRSKDNVANMTLRYGVDQNDKQMLRACKTDVFGSDMVDMVIDDASHLYDSSVATFEALFPYVRPGGAYVIEDWGWAHWSNDFWQSQTHPHITLPALSNLVFQVTMMCATNPNLIRSVDINSGTCIITKGTDELSDEFDLQGMYQSRGKKMSLI